MNYTKLFYWLTVADNAKDLFIAGIAISMIIFTIATAINAALTIEPEDCDFKGRVICRKWQKFMLPFIVLFWSLYVFTPSKKDALLIVAGGQTLNFLANDESAKEIPSELSGFILTELKTMAKETKVELGVQSQKEKILDTAREMTTEELLNKMKTDSIFSKTLLNE